MTVTIYTDASHHPKLHIAACSFVVLVEGKIIKHRVVLVDNLTKSKAAEIYAIIQGLQYSFMIDGVDKIELFTDYQPIVEFRNVRGKFLQDNPVYPEYLETVEMIREYGIVVDIKWVKGHSRNEMNRKVDNSARSNLRKYLKQRNDIRRI